MLMRVSGEIFSRNEDPWTRRTQMSSIEEAIRWKFESAIKMTDMNEANEALRDIVAEHGIGVAILVAWQHGLQIGHIPLTLNRDHDVRNAPKVQIIGSDEGCPYMFVHVPVRQYRRSTDKLVEYGILNPNADPALFVYHEDGLVGTFSILNPESKHLTEESVAEILRALAQQGVLVRANIDNRQIQFKDLSVKRRIESSGKQVYVRVDHHSLERENIRLPTALDREEVWDYVISSLKFRFACNYCSVQALSPRQATINSAYAPTRGQHEDEQATVRNYQLGFTFAPVGHPGAVCHFLAWDFPHISDLVMNMEPQSYSFSDLIRLVRVINRDITEFCRDNGVHTLPENISGACNHWAGNSIYHQHYQFFRIAHLPLTSVGETSELLATYQDVEVRRAPATWQTPAFLIRSLRAGGDEDVMKVADRVAREWRVLNKDEDRSYGDEIVIKNHTQNILVTIEANQLTAIFIPRYRLKVDTEGIGNAIQKSNAGILEMMGYLVIDEPADFDVIRGMSRQEQKSLGDSWLSELAPDPDTVQEFEENVKICLSTAVDPYEQRIDELLVNKLGDWRSKAQNLVFNIQHDGLLDAKQREHLYRELAWAVLESAAVDVIQPSTE